MKQKASAQDGKSSRSISKKPQIYPSSTTSITKKLKIHFNQKAPVQYPYQIDPVQYPKIPSSISQKLQISIREPQLNIVHIHQSKTPAQYPTPPRDLFPKSSRSISNSPSSITETKIQIHINQKPQLNIRNKTDIFKKPQLNNLNTVTKKLQIHTSQQTRLNIPPKNTNKYSKPPPQ